MGIGIIDWLFGSIEEKEKLIKDISIRREQDYQRVEIDLGTERTEERIFVAGVKIEVGAYDGNSTGCYFSLNSEKASNIYPFEVQKITSPFESIYLTNTAQTGKKLVIYTSFNPDAVESIREVGERDSRFTSHTWTAGTKTSADAAAALSPTSLKFRNVTIRVDTYNAYVGDSSSQPVLVEKDTFLIFDFVDLNEVYIKNAGAGENAVANWFGTEEK